MALIARVNVGWSIPNAGPCVSVLHFTGDQPAALIGTSVTAFRAMLAQLAGFLPNEVTAVFPPEYTLLEDTTGTLVGYGSLPVLAALTGTGAGTWAAGSGVRVTWGTNAIRRGRRVVGSTYIVPVIGTSFDGSGRVASAAVTAFNNAAGIFLTAAAAAAPMVVYGRPTPDASGGAHPVLTVSTSSLAATLRGRKY